MTALLVFALAPAAAMAASSSSTGYSTAAGVAQDTISDPSDEGNGSNLPFTGFDALAVGGAGLLLAGVGVGLRTLSRRGREPGDEQLAA